MRRMFAYRTLIAVLAVLFGSAIAFAENEAPLPVRFTAWAINTGRGAASIDLTVTRWSTTGEVEKLSSAFNERGTDGLVRALEEMPRVGMVRANGGLGLDVQFVQRTFEPDGSQRVFVIAERRVGIAEMVNMTPSSGYPLIAMELHVNHDGDGTGTMWPVARISYWDPKTQFVVVDNYPWQPIQLTSVKVQRDHRA